MFEISLDFEIINTHKNEDSRIILINMKLKDKAFPIININAPNMPSERKGFFSKVKKVINQYAMYENE